MCLTLYLSLSLSPRSHRYFNNWSSRLLIFFHLFHSHALPPRITPGRPREQKKHIASTHFFPHSRHFQDGKRGREREREATWTTAARLIWICGTPPKLAGYLTKQNLSLSLSFPHLDQETLFSHNFLYLSFLHNTQLDRPVFSQRYFFLSFSNAKSYLFQFGISHIHTNNGCTGASRAEFRKRAKLNNFRFFSLTFVKIFKSRTFYEASCRARMKIFFVKNTFLKSFSFGSIIV